MNPYLPFAAIPVAVSAAWFASDSWSGSYPGRYQVPAVTQIENPSVPTVAHRSRSGTSDVRVEAFLPHVPPKPPQPTPNLTLYSVMTGSEVNFASINGHLVQQGDMVAGYRVQRITKNGVDLVSGSDKRHLPMRALHELPPPVEPGVDVHARNAASQQSTDNLTQDFWATFGASNSGTGK